MQQQQLPTPALTADEKKERQRQHVRRSYNRKLDKLHAMRALEAELKAQYLFALGERETQLQLRDKPRSALKRFVQVARAKESLVEENAALREQLELRVAVAHRSSRLVLQFGDEAGAWRLTTSWSEPSLSAVRAERRAGGDRFCVVDPVTLDECQRINSETYKKIREFLESDAHISSDLGIFGWRDRRKIDGDRLQFSLQKDFTNATALDLSQRTWEIVANPLEHRSLHSPSLHARLYRAQLVDANSVVLYRVFMSEDRQYAAKSVFLVSRFAVESGFMVLLRSIDKGRLRKNELSFEGLFIDDDEPPELLLENEQWLDVFSWLAFEQNGESCKLDFGGDVLSTGVASSTLWMLEVLLIALRWETKAIGPIISLPAP